MPVYSYDVSDFIELFKQSRGKVFLSYIAVREPKIVCITLYHTICTITWSPVFLYSTE